MASLAVVRREGKVAQILNERQLVINLGAKDGVKRGMRFAVLAATPTEIVDPDTGEVLGIVDREKVKVEAVEVQERLSVCATYEILNIGGTWDTSFSFALTRLFGPRIEVPESLRIPDNAGLPPLGPEESFVKVGDRVRELLRDPASRSVTAASG